MVRVFGPVLGCGVMMLVAMAVMALPASVRRRRDAQDADALRREVALRSLDEEPER